MKQILLTGAAYLNGGAYVDAGNTVAVGDAKHEITEERAADIVKCGRADEVEIDEEEIDVEESDGLEEMIVADLKKLAADETVDLGHATKKSEIVTAIRAHREAASGEG